VAAQPRSYPYPLGSFRRYFPILEWVDSSRYGQVGSRNSPQYTGHRKGPERHHAPLPALQSMHLSGSTYPLPPIRLDLSALPPPSQLTYPHHDRDYHVPSHGGDLFPLALEHVPRFLQHLLLPRENMSVKEPKQI
jgi:hypothetical protein